MLFNSLEFAVFFPIVCCLFFAAPMRMRLPFLLVASCVFYMAFIPAYILILAITILIDYVGGILLERHSGPIRRVILLASIVSTCLVLFIFKYFDFFLGNFVSLASLAGWKVGPITSGIILPIGLSFHTFQSLSYVVEVYRGKQRAEYDFVTYATYVMFFPQLVAGPIERPQNLLHQFKELQPYDHDRVVAGLKRMAWGFFKKLVVADRLAIFVNDVFSAPREHNGLQLTIGTLFFAYQIYCDFSGYSDIALGSARVLGFTLMENFDVPYRSRSISEFWRRWHISLSTWFKDYVYVPLGGSRVSNARWIFNVLVTFGISGLWHGANWTYVIWGLLNGMYLIMGRFTQNIRDKFFHAIRIENDSALRVGIRVLTTFVLVNVAWVFFRARNFNDATYVLTHFWKGWNFSQIVTEQFTMRQFSVAILSIVLLELGHFLSRNERFVLKVNTLPVFPRWATYLACVLFVALFGIYRTNQFIYFQF
jgi:D-alanyl-lipoteichoic acid acyltransferase DltB (MBOAT superfamily)